MFTSQPHGCAITYQFVNICRAVGTILLLVVGTTWSRLLDFTFWNFWPRWGLFSFFPWSHYRQKQNSQDSISVLSAICLFLATFLMQKSCSSLSLSCALIWQQGSYCHILWVKPERMWTSKEGLNPRCAPWTHHTDNGHTKFLSFQNPLSKSLVLMPMASYSNVRYSAMQPANIKIFHFKQNIIRHSQLWPIAL